MKGGEEGRCDRDTLQVNKFFRVNTISVNTKTKESVFEDQLLVLANESKGSILKLLARDLQAVED